MKSRQVIIELQGSRVEVIVRQGGRCVRAHRISVNLSPEPAGWIESIGGISDKLALAVQKLGVEGQSAIVLYTSPSQIVELAGFEVKSARDACDAARLRCSDSMPVSVNSTICESVCVGVDSHGPKRKFHTVAVAEREDVLAAIEEMVERAGLKFDHATPIAAVISKYVSVRATSEKASCQGMLYVGERHSCFLVTEKGAIVFSRLINIGLESLVRSLTRTFHVNSRILNIDLNAERAREMLHTCGIPSAKFVVPEDFGISAQQIIPMMQPVLQRLVVELRQSLRFGLTERQRQEISLVLTGPGSSLKGFSECLGHELEIEFALDDEYAEFDYTTPGAPGSEVINAIDQLETQDDLRLLTKSLTQARWSGRLRQWLWTGAAAAVAMIVIDAVGYEMQLKEAHWQLETIEVFSSQFEKLEKNSARLQETIVALQELDHCIFDEMGTSVDLQAAMNEISQLTPSSILFNRISFQNRNQGAVGSMMGYAFVDVMGGNQLEEFMDRLRRSPLFSQVQLLNVQVGRHEGRQTQRFDISFVQIESPQKDLWNKHALELGGTAR